MNIEMMQKPIPQTLSAELSVDIQGFAQGILSESDTAVLKIDVWQDTSDLKRDKLTHQDLGQMQMYVNYFDRFVKTKDELPTVGIILCRRKNDALVELTLPKDTNIFASKYQLYLPSKAALKAQLVRIAEELQGGEYE